VVIRRLLAQRGGQPLTGKRREACKFFLPNPLPPVVGREYLRKNRIRTPTYVFATVSHGSFSGNLATRPICFLSYLLRVWPMYQMYLFVSFSKERGDSEFFF
jgi:hypothetical protein